MGIGQSGQRRLTRHCRSLQQVHNGQKDAAAELLVTSIGMPWVTVFLLALGKKFFITPDSQNNTTNPHFTSLNKINSELIKYRHLIELYRAGFDG